MERLLVRADGASRGNPGPAAIGATIRDEQGRLLASISQAIGRATNNQAEYRAVIAALEGAIRLGARWVEIGTDSQLVVRQLKGSYRVKAASLKPLHQQLRQLLSKLDGYQVIHVPREENPEADALARAALR